MVIEHLMQKNNEQFGDSGQNNKLNNTDFVHISDLFSPSQKGPIKGGEPNNQQQSSSVLAKS